MPAKQDELLGQFRALVAKEDYASARSLFNGAESQLDPQEILQCAAYFAGAQEFDPAIGLLSRANTNTKGRTAGEQRQAVTCLLLEDILRMVTGQKTVHSPNMTIGKRSLRMLTPALRVLTGIFGVMAYYVVSFPRARFAYFFPVVRHFRLLGWIDRAAHSGWACVPAWLLFVFYAIYQLVTAWQQIYGYTNISALAHLGGIAVGLTAGFVSRRLRRKQCVRL